MPSAVRTLLSDSMRKRQGRRRCVAAAVAGAAAVSVLTTGHQLRASSLAAVTSGFPASVAGLAGGSLAMAAAGTAVACASRTARGAMPRAVPSGSGGGASVRKGSDLSAADWERTISWQMGDTSLTASIINLSKNIIGAGILSLPFAMKGAGVVPFLLGALVFGLLNAYTFFLLGWACNYTGAKTFGELWAFTFGKKSAWVADLAVLTNNTLGCLAYCVVAGDFLSKGMAGLLPSVEVLHFRGADLLLVGFFLLLPLSLLKDLSKLSFSSILGLVATLWGFTLVTGDCLSNVDLTDPEGAVQRNLMPLRVDLFQSLALLSSAFMAHYNSPKFFASLENSTLPRWGTLVASSFGLALVAFSTFALCGFALFGFGVEGNILTNYGGGTQVMLAWLGMAFSMIFTYPLLFSALRDAASALLVRTGVIRGEMDESFRIAFTAIMVAVTVLGGTFFTNVAVVNGVKGAILSACLAFIFPALIQLRLTRPDGAAAAAASPAMRLASYVIIAIGVTTGIMALLAMFVLPKTDFSALAAAVEATH